MPDPNADIIKGYRFVATLQLRTPLRVLRHHGEFHNWSEAGLPQYAQAAWEGIWVPVTKSWAELAGSKAKLHSEQPKESFEALFRQRLVEHGFSASEAANVVPNAVSSDIGPVPEDGGMYLGFLNAFRGIVEFPASPEEKREAIEALAMTNTTFEKYIEIHRRQSRDWPDAWLGYEEWLELPEIGVRVARQLYNAGLQTPGVVHRATDNQLRAIEGIGKATVARIRQVSACHLP